MAGGTNQGSWATSPCDYRETLGNHFTNTMDAMNSFAPQANPQSILQMQLGSVPPSAKSPLHLCTLPALRALPSSCCRPLGAAGTHSSSGLARAGPEDTRHARQRRLATGDPDGLVLPEAMCGQQNPEGSQVQASDMRLTSNEESVVPPAAISHTRESDF